jgi:hypothetical protein
MKSLPDELASTARFAKNHAGVKSMRHARNPKTQVTLNLMFSLNPKQKRCLDDFLKKHSNIQRLARSCLVGG